MQLYDNCSSELGGGGGWWYANCHRANLNGKYVSPPTNNKGVFSFIGIIWYDFNGAYVLEKTVMKVKRKL